MFPVLADDYGIRPAGAINECFYCRKIVGEMHGPECVVIVRDNTYAVYAGETLIGHWTHDDPADWDDDRCEFHKNESSWCKNNIDDANYRGVPLPRPADDEGCMCGLLDLVLVAQGREPRRSHRS